MSSIQRIPMKSYYKIWLDNLIKYNVGKYIYVCDYLKTIDLKEEICERKTVRFSLYYEKYNYILPLNSNCMIYDIKIPPGVQYRIIMGGQEVDINCISKYNPIMSCLLYYHQVYIDTDIETTITYKKIIIDEKKIKYLKDNLCLTQNIIIDNNCLWFNLFRRGVTGGWIYADHKIRSMYSFNIINRECHCNECNSIVSNYRCLSKYNNSPIYKICYPTYYKSQVYEILDTINWIPDHGDQYFLYKELFESIIS